MGHRWDQERDGYRYQAALPGGPEDGQGRRKVFVAAGANGAS